MAFASRASHTRVWPEAVAAAPAGVRVHRNDRAGSRKRRAQRTTACGSGPATHTTRSAIARAVVTFKERDGTQVVGRRRSVTTVAAVPISKTYPSLSLGQLIRVAFVRCPLRHRDDGNATPTGCPARSSSTASDASTASACFNGAGVKIAESFSAVEASGLQGVEKYRQRQVASGGTTVSAYSTSFSARSPRGEAICRRRRQFDGQLRRGRAARAPLRSPRAAER